MTNSSMNYFINNNAFKNSFPFVLRPYSNYNTGLNAGGGASDGSRITVHSLCSSRPDIITCQWEFDGYIEPNYKAKGYIKNKNNMNLYVSVSPTDNVVKFVKNCNDDNCRWNFIPSNDKNNAVKIINNNGVGLKLPSNIHDDVPIEASVLCNIQSNDNNCLWNVYEK